RDGMIFNTRACDFDPVVALTCRGPKTDGCLTSQQTAALKKAFAGPRDSRGNQVYPGFLFDTGITSSGQGIPGLLSPGPGPLGPPNLQTEIDVDKDAAALADDPRQVGDTKALDESEHVLGSRQQAGLLPRCQRSVVLGTRHRRLLREDEHG